MNLNKKTNKEKPKITVTKKIENKKKTPPQTKFEKTLNSQNYY